MFSFFDDLVLLKLIPYKMITHFSFLKKPFIAMLFLITISVVTNASNNDKPCCSKKCTGSEYCSACKNCSGCNYCNSGGYCGVCRPEAFKKPVKKTTVKPQIKPKTQVKKKK